MMMMMEEKKRIDEGEAKFPLSRERRERKREREGVRIRSPATCYGDFCCSLFAFLFFLFFFLGFAVFRHGNAPF